eukprot:214322-Amphidinium_carterae.1
MNSLANQRVANQFYLALASLDAKVYGIESCGRRKYRTLEFTTDARFAMWQVTIGVLVTLAYLPNAMEPLFNIWSIQYAQKLSRTSFWASELN